MIGILRTLFLASLVLVGCTKGDRVPAYVEVAPFTLTTTTAQGAATHKITDAWVSVDERLIGVWELPARIPVLGEGRKTISVVPAVKRNGMFDDRVRYPFLNTFTGPVDLVREGTTVVAPTTTYKSNTVFWIEGFDDPDFARLSVLPASDTTLERFTPASNPELLYIDDSPCGGFTLDATHRYFGLYTDEDFALASGAVFLELDYRCDIFFTVGVLYTSSNISSFDPVVFVAPTVRSNGFMPWNKIYVDLTGFFNSPGVSQRDIYLEARLPDGATSGTVYLDNLKIVRFGS
ncbi:MAG: hypothetical protein ACK46G_08615 [Flavobacteriales bacterium]|jgi:hypothetical protein